MKKIVPVGLVATAMVVGLSGCSDILQPPESPPNGPAFSIAPATVNILDGFEGATIDPFWIVVEQRGTVGLSTDQAHSGSQSVKMSSDPSAPCAPSGPFPCQRNLRLLHHFPQPLKGTISVWLYDNARASLYAALDVFNLTVPPYSLGSRFVLLVRDWDGSMYHVDNVRTSIRRTVGWHEFRMNFNEGDVEFLIDGTLALTRTGDFAFDMAALEVFGPGQNATFYWDDFTVQARPADVVPVQIDIKPGSDPNSINCNNPNGNVAVAILSDGDFNATDVDHTTVGFAGAGESHVDKKSGEARRHEEDVDGDGDTDLVFHFRLGDTDLTCASEEATLSGETFDGQAIEGTDEVRMITGGGRG